MKNLTKILFVAVLFACSPAFADPRDLTYKSIDELPTMSVAPATDDLSVVYDNSERKFKKRLALPSGNPLVEGFYQSVTVAELSATEVLIPADSNKTFQVLDYSLESSGALSGATLITIECTGGTDLAAIGIGAFGSGISVGPETSAPSTTTQAAMFDNGPCPAGEGVQVKAPAAATATHMRVNLQYIAQ